ncbi:MAG: hypothetical protein Q4B54_10355 [Coriobacteriales bacterium]|nr:hypothetical protein [Coriobacteriales bacterium]
MEFQDLTREQKDKFAACSTPEEIMAVVQEEGIDLTDEQMEMVSGGGARKKTPIFKEMPNW